MTSPRERLLQAARDVLAADGLEGLTLRAIARQAGVSHGAPLRHFPTLASLLAAVAADGFARLIATVDGHLVEADAKAEAEGTVLDARRRLAVAGQAYIDFALADPGVFSVTFRPERVDVSDAQYQAQGDAAFRQLVELVEAAQAEGWRPDLPPDELAAVVWANVHGLAVLTLHGGLGGVIGDEAARRLPALSIALGLDLPVPMPARPSPALAGTGPPAPRTDPADDRG